MSGIKVSVIIPVYNAEKYLNQCLDSLVCQTLKNIEIICVDAGSDDNSLNILRKYEDGDTRVTVITDKGRLDAGSARNIGLEIAKGEYLSFLDADDFFEPDMLEKAYLKSVQHKSDVTVFGCDIFYNSQNRFTPCNYSIEYSLLPHNNPFCLTDVRQDAFKLFVGWAWDKLFKADFIKKNNIKFQQQRTTNDMLFVFSSLLKAEKIFVMDDVLAHYRQEQGSLSVTRERSWHCFYDALTALNGKLIEWNLYNRFEQDYINYCLHFSLWNLNTLKEPSHTLLHNKLKDEWLDNFGIMSHDKKYFYNKYEYLLFENAFKKEKRFFKLEAFALKNSGTISRLISVTKNKGIVFTVGMIKNKIINR